MPVGFNQPIQYTQPTQGVSPVLGNQQQVVTPQAQKSSISGYPYGDDVFTGQFQTFKPLYGSFDNSISKFSPFFGKMQNAQIPQSNPIGAGGVSQQPQGNAGQAQANLGFVDSGSRPPLQNNTFVPPSGNVGIVPDANQHQPQVIAHPKKTYPSGPVVNNLQQQLQQEAQGLQTPQKAVESVASHAMLSRQERTIANDVSWGAKFYAQKANESAQQLLKNKATMNPAQIQAKVREVETLKIKSISLLNEAKKHAINTYTEAVKATLIYNNYFTENTQFASVMSDNDRQFVESEIDKTWTNWSNGFEKQVNGQVVHADEAPTVIDKTARDVAISMDQTNKIIASISSKTT